MKDDTNFPVSSDTLSNCKDATTIQLYYVVINRWVWRQSKTLQGAMQLYSYIKVRLPGELFFCGYQECTTTEKGYAFFSTEVMRFADFPDVGVLSMLPSDRRIDISFAKFSASDYRPKNEGQVFKEVMQ